MVYIKLREYGRSNFFPNFIYLVGYKMTVLQSLVELSYSGKGGESFLFFTASVDLERKHTKLFTFWLSTGLWEPRVPLLPRRVVRRHLLHLRVRPERRRPVVVCGAEASPEDQPEPGDAARSCRRQPGGRGTGPDKSAQQAGGKSWC
jgi:hypothetical protein